MCDQDHFDEDFEKYSRRDFGKLTAVGLGGVFALSTSTGPADLLDVDVAENEVLIDTPDGKCDAYWVKPKEGLFPAVLVWPDIFGLRPAFREMGKRLAREGYCVLVVNPFYRKQESPTAAQGAQTPIGDVISLARSLDAEKQVTDAKAFVAWIDRQDGVDKNRKIASAGYCMGGPIVFRTAAAVPDRVGAAATFHGGGLVTENTDSPHKLIPSMRAQFLIAIAENDDQRDPKSKEVLKESFAAQKLAAEIEVYPAGHGWCPPDTKVYNEEQAERAWKRMLDLFQRCL